MKNMSFHTFRHWGATILYYKTRDPLLIQRRFGHKNIRNTQIYIQINDGLFQNQLDDFHSATAQNVEDAKKINRSWLRIRNDLSGHINVSKTQVMYHYIIQNYPDMSQFMGMSWYVTPSGRVRRIVIGKTPRFSSSMAMSMGLERSLVGCIKIGAPMAICRALAPTIRAFSNRVSLEGPIKFSLLELVFLEHS